jgi:hypothetical protein
MSETQSVLVRLKTRLVDDYGAKVREGADIHFFELPYFSDADKGKQLEAFALDSAYAAVATTDELVAFRAYIQLKEYVARCNSGWLKLVTESAEHIARRRIEDRIRGTI